VPRWLLALGAVLLLGVDLLFLAANLTKVRGGAWLPLLIGITVFAVMSTWQRGHEIVTAERTRREGSLREFVDRLRKDGSSTLRVPGTAVFLNRGKQTVPLAMRTNVEYNHVRHEHVVIVTVETKPVPRVPADQRLVVDDLGHDDGITHVCVRFGYLETPDVQLRCEHSPRPRPRAGYNSTRRPTSCRRSNSNAATRRPWRPGVSGCSSPPPTSPLTTPSTSPCPATAPSS
jgi:KUP system potassium uptake protein